MLAAVSCIVATARGAVWAEHVAGIGVAADNTLQLLTRHGHSHPMAASYAGDRIPQVSAAVLAAIDAVVRTAARDSRITTVITLDDELVIHLYEYQSATWAPVRATKVFTIAHVAADSSVDQGDDLTPPDTHGEQ